MHAIGAGERPIDPSASRSILLLGAAVGISSFLYYYFVRDLTVAHYDAKAHLLVARRIFDSLDPGYTQMGVHWLPLTHLLYLPFVMIESQYRSGVLPSLISVASFAFSGWLTFRIACRATGSGKAGAFAALFLIANPNLLYLQSCPMTEPLYMLLMLLALDSLQRWREHGQASLPWGSSSWAALGALCRYEGWYFVAGIVILLGYDFFSRTLPRKKAARGALLHIGMFALAVFSHFGYLYFQLGSSFLHRVIQGNPVPSVTYQRPFLSLWYHLCELIQIAAIVPLLVGLAGVVFCFLRLRRWPEWAPLFLLWIPSLINVSALYWGMIYRVRYSILLLPAIAVFASVLAGSIRAQKRVLLLGSVSAMTLPWLSWFFPYEWKFHFFYPGPGMLFLPAVALVIFLLSNAKKWFYWPLLALCALAMQIPVLSGENRAILVETLEHEFIEPEKQEVLNHLRLHYDGTRILIDMGRLAPLIYDSRLPVREYVYNEGKQSIWRMAVKSPHGEVGWLCAEKGDVIWNLLQIDPRWAERYVPAVETENYRLYRLRLEDRRRLLPAGRSE